MPPERSITVLLDDMELASTFSPQGSEMERLALNEGCEGLY